MAAPDYPKSAELQHALLAFTASCSEAIDHADNEPIFVRFLQLSKLEKVAPPQTSLLTTRLAAFRALREGGTPCQARADKLYAEMMKETKALLEKKEKAQKDAIDAIRKKVGNRSRIMVASLGSLAIVTVRAPSLWLRWEAKDRAHGARRRRSQSKGKSPMPMC